MAKNPKICVIGWYGHQNLGDEAFKESFHALWPDFHFTFRDRPPGPDEPFDALWVGGGSFFDQPFHPLRHLRLPIGVIGVGLSSAIHANNLETLDRARIVVVRDQRSQRRWGSAVLAPDLVFARQPLPAVPRDGVTVLLNDFLTPRGTSLDWQATSYSWFCQELAKVLDRLVERGERLRFLPMQVGAIDDRRIAAAVIGRMRHRDRVEWWIAPPDEMELRRCIAASRLVVTQRFHGLVFSTIEQTPVVTITAHDKLSGLLDEMGTTASGIDYYGMTDRRFLDALDYATSTPPPTYGRLAKERWQCISATVAKLFCF